MGDNTEHPANRDDYSAPMTREEIDALVASKYPNALRSTVAATVREITGDFRNEAALHAVACLEAIDGWTVETLGHNIESSYPELDPDECDEIAAAAIAKARGE